MRFKPDQYQLKAYSITLYAALSVLIAMDALFCLLSQLDGTNDEKIK